MKSFSLKKILNRSLCFLHQQTDLCKYQCTVYVCVRSFIIFRGSRKHRNGQNRRKLFRSIAKIITANFITLVSNPFANPCFLPVYYFLGGRKHAKTANWCVRKRPNRQNRRQVMMLINLTSSFRFFENNLYFVYLQGKNTRRIHPKTVGIQR